MIFSSRKRYDGEASWHLAAVREATDDVTSADVAGVQRSREPSQRGAGCVRPLVLLRTAHLHDWMEGELQLPRIRKGKMREKAVCLPSLT